MKNVSPGLQFRLQNFWERLNDDHMINQLFSTIRDELTKYGETN